MVQKFVVDKSGVEKSGVERSGVEMSFNHNRRYEFSVLIYIYCGYTAVHHQEMGD